MSALESQYRRLLRWYPKQWRARNEAAVTGALLDKAENEGRTAPTFDDRASLALGGLHERFLRVERPSVVTVAAFGAAAAFSIWYVSIISWSPQIPAYAGTLGSFSNPAVTTGVVYLVALALVLARRVQLARITAIVGVLWAITLLVLNLSLGWMGPGESASALFVGFGIVAALGVSRWRELAAFVVAIVAAGLSVATAQIAVMTYPFVFVAQFWIATVIAIAAGAAAVLIMAISVVSRAQRIYAVRQ